MNWLEFISSVINSVAWPLLIVLSAYFFREPLTRAVSQGFRRVRIGPSGIEIDFEQVDTLLKKVESPGDLSQAEGPVQTTDDPGPIGSLEKLKLIEASPTGAFMASYIDLERNVRKLLVQLGAEVEDLSPRQIGERAREYNLLTHDGLVAYQWIRNIRNQVVHGYEDELTVPQAVSLVALIDALNSEATSGAYIKLRDQMQRSDELHPDPAT